MSSTYSVVPVAALCLMLAVTAVQAADDQSESDENFEYRQCDTESHQIYILDTVTLDTVCCSRWCLKRSNCYGFTYDKSSKHCRLMSVVADSGSSQQCDASRAKSPELTFTRTNRTSEGWLFKMRTMNQILPS